MLVWSARIPNSAEEEQFYAGFMEAKTLKEKAETGYAWYPIQFVSSQHTINDYLEVKIERTGEKFSYGDPYGSRTRVFRMRT